MPRAAQLTQSLIQHLEERSSHTALGFPARGIFDLQGNLIDWVKARFQQSIAEQIDTPAERIAIREAALTVFDRWDIPKIDGMVEAAVKALFRPGLVGLIDALLNLSDELLQKGN